jgi:uncharacterized Zn finger protein
MAYIPNLNKREILLWLDEDEQIFQRGYRYLQRRMIFNTTREGATLRASSHGSENRVYQLWLRFDGKKIEDSDCSCPYERECKHLVALLLQWAFTPEEFTEMASTSE